jgi:hypothetical protein
MTAVDLFLQFKVSRGSYFPIFVRCVENYVIVDSSEVVLSTILFIRGYSTLGAY